MRFKESIKRFTLPKGWGWVPIKDLAKLSFSSVDKKSVEGEKPVRLCNYMDVFYNRRIREGIPFMASTASDSEIKKFTLNKGDVVLTKDSETPEEIAFAAVIDEQIDNLVCGYHLAVLRPDKAKVTGEYLMSAINFHPNHHQFVRLANGATRFGLGIDSLNNALLPLPPLAEQRKIAEILRTWDEAIETTEAELKAKQERKRWLVNHLVGYLPGTKTFRLCDLFERVIRKNSTGCTMSLTISASAGLVNQREIFSRKITSTDASKYFLVKKGEYAYNRSHSIGNPYGVIRRLSRYEEGIVSPIYLVFKSRSEEVDPLYADMFFESGGLNKQLRKIAQEGARAHGLLNVTAEDFFSMKISLPGLAKQRERAEILSVINREIEVNSELVHSIREQKRGLMQKLLTGEVRVTR